MANHHSAFQAAGVSIVAISTDTDAGHRDIESLTGGAFPLLADGDARVIQALNLVDPFEVRPVPTALPAVFLVDASGIVRYRYIGRAPEDRPRSELLLLAAEQMTRRT